MRMQPMSFESILIRIRAMGVLFGVAIFALCGLRDGLSAETAGNSPELAKVVMPLVEGHQGEVGVAIKFLKTGELFEHEAARPMPTASLIKLPVMLATYDAVRQGRLSLETMIELRKEDVVGGSGILATHFSPGAKFSLRDAIRLMIAYSDNTATNLVVDQVGLKPTNEFISQLGCPETRINSKVFRRDTSIDRERSIAYGLGSTTAHDMVSLCERLYAKKLVTPEACDQMLGHLYHCEGTTKSTRLLPPGTRVAHKTGSVNSSRTDAGIIESPAGPILFCVLTDKNKDQSWTDDNAGDMLCSKIAAAAYHYFNPQAAVPVVVTNAPLQVGASGELVTALQRTLNVHRKPEAAIGTDGDFGPETENAVKAFQKEQKLPESGIVDAATWKALGPLVMNEEPAPEPAVVNAEPSKKSPPDPLVGPPFVTCKSWAIVDGDSGELLASNGADTKRDPASTTKIMTAYLVSLVAERDPKVLEEIVTFSERADKTPGTTCDLRAGEKVSVGELLFGMMLPSGNDATVAFAEHFGERLASDADKEAKLDAYDSFISVMNRKAAELGMNNTQYKNPHGLTSEGHQTTAHDLIRLAMAAFKLPLFRNVVDTPRHGATLDSTAGYQRNIVWRNTNQLLGIEGYDGVKTGTTNAAGACLVSTGQRAGKRLFVAVLGSTSGDGRYTDSRNLYRWAWRDLLKLHDDTQGTAASAAAK
ncbi:MAG: serine hydrolase [Pirellulales bacterium]|nr:serine hydrolase [Pirellulales bacterium]